MVLRRSLQVALLLIIIGAGVLLFKTLSYHPTLTNEITCSTDSTCPQPFAANVALSICGTETTFERETTPAKEVPQQSSPQKLKDFFMQIGTSFDGACLGETCNGDTCQGKPGIFKMWVGDKLIKTSSEYIIKPGDLIVLSFQQRSDNKRPNVSQALYTGPYYFFPRKIRDGMNIAKKYELDSKETKLEWEGSSIVQTNSGSINITEGSIQVDELGKEFLSGRFTIDMKSITNTNLPDGPNTMLTNHLKSAEFFDVEKFPTSELTIISVTKTVAPDMYDVRANLTIKNITNRIEFPAKIVQNNDKKIIADSKINIDRTKWGISNLSQIVGTTIDKAIRNEVTLNLHLVME